MNPRDALKDPRVWKDAPKPIHEAVKEYDRLEEVYREQFSKRDAATGAINAAEQKDHRAVMAAFGGGGSGDKVNPTEHADAAREDAKRQQSLLTGIASARDAAASNLRAALAEHGEAWEAQLLSELALAEGELERVVSEARKVRAALTTTGALLDVARARGGKTGMAKDGPGTEVKGWGGNVHLGQAVAKLEEAATCIGADGEPAIHAPFDVEAG